MSMQQVFRVATVLMLAVAPQALALTAVVEVNETGWYTIQKAALYNNTALTRFYAPLPVYFEGWKSSPREDIVEWIWDFGDGAPLFRGFNAAHVYETPGQYTATLTVVDRDGATSQASIPVEVLARTGQTYYVDSVVGNDANAGTTPETPWRTATKAFGGMNERRYGPGDRILFRRGQQFDLEAGVINPAGNMMSYGYYFGAFGEGAKPIIKHVGTSTADLISIGTNYLAFWGLMDLDFDCTSAEGAVSCCLIVKGASSNLFVLRCEIRNHLQAVGFNGDHLTRQISGAYIIGCNIHHSLGTNAMHTYTKASRYAQIDNVFDMSDDHVGYHSYLDKAIFSGNVYSRWAFGRLALRSCGVTDAAHPTNNVHIINNQFIGWIDPKIDTWAHTGRGTRYNLNAVELGPNTTTDQWMEYAIVENNVFKDTEKFMEIGDWEHVIVRNNKMSTVSTASGNVRIQVGHPYERRPVMDIDIYQNTIVSNESRAGTAGIFFIGWYGGAAYAGRTLHEDIYIAHNRVTFQNGDARLITVGTQSASQIAQITSNANAVYGATQAQAIFQCGGTYNAPEAIYSLPEWRLLTGNDRATLILSATSQVPLPGAASAPAQCEGAPVPVSYEGALCVNGSGLKAVHLWARKDDGAWADTGLSSPSANGSFLYSGISGSGTYYFATQAEDNNGVFSPAPTDFGHATTTHQELGGADTTAPWPATAAAPAVASASPIPVHYSGASDMGGSGLKAVHLWVRKDAGAWAATGLSQTTAEGDFQFTVPAGDGVYYFATRSEDNGGNFSPEPTGTGDALTVFDTTPPAAGTLNTPGLVKAAGAVSITYSGAGDGGSGLRTVALWVRKDAGGWANSGLTLSTSSGTFNYTPAGSGNYYFELVAVDNAGISSSAPSGNGQGYLVYDGEAPTAGTVTAPATADRKPIAVQYSGAGDALSGLKTVSLWVKKGGAGTWGATGLSSASASGSFNYDGMSGNDTYYFAVQAEDGVGNTSATPSGVGSAATAYQSVLTPGTATAPAYDTASPIPVAFSGAFDSNDNGISLVHLWYKKGAAGVWTASGLSIPAESGTFNLVPSGNDTYYFAVQAQNSAGDKSPTPSGAGDCSTVFDTTAPVSGAAAATAMTRTAPITVTYSGASDALSGLQSVTLWAKKGTAAWASSGLSQTTASGSFAYSPSGSGTYYFAVVAKDKAGLSSASPSGSGQATCVYDVDKPVAGTVSAPATASTEPIAVGYSGASDAVSGLQTVYLWMKKGSAGTWTQTSLSSTTASGTFQYSGLTGSDTYYFALQAEDKAGNLSAAPSGSVGAGTVYQAEVYAGTAASPAYAQAAPITVTYSGASDGASGIKAVYLWSKKGAAGAWIDTGLSSTTESGSFSFTATSGDDTYYFATQAENNNGVRSATPSGDGHSHTVLDSAAPTMGAASAPSSTKTSPITVTYSGVSDTGSGLAGVTLWVKKDTGTWATTGLSQTTGSGSFSYTPTQNSGTYRFALVATDKAGNATAAPSGDGLAACIYDTVAPTVGTLTAPATADRGPIVVSYTGVTDANSGIKTVTLWVKIGTAGTWAPTSLTATAASGSFNYGGMTTNEKYCFAIRCEDNAGNLSAAPSGDGAAATQYTRVLTGGTVTAPQYTNVKPIRVTFSGAADSGGALKGVHLWFRKGATGTWTDSGLFVAAASGGFDFTAVTTDDTYYFGVQAETTQGLKGAAPSGNGAASSVYDTSKPLAGTVSAPRSVNRVPLTVSYSGVSDTGSGVKHVILWMKESRSGVWVDTGLRSTAVPSGQFSVSSVSRDTKYYFFTQVEDKAGNLTAAPTDSAVLTP